MVLNPLIKFFVKRCIDLSKKCIKSLLLLIIFFILIHLHIINTKGILELFHQFFRLLLRQVAKLKLNHSLENSRLRWMASPNILPANLNLILDLPDEGHKSALNHKTFDQVALLPQSVINIVVFDKLLLLLFHVGLSVNASCIANNGAN